MSRFWRKNSNVDDITIESLTIEKILPLPSKCKNRNRIEKMINLFSLSSGLKKNSKRAGLSCNLEQSWFRSITKWVSESLHIISPLQHSLRSSKRGFRNGWWLRRLLARAEDWSAEKSEWLKMSHKKQRKWNFFRETTAIDLW